MLMCKLGALAGPSGLRVGRANHKIDGSKMVKKSLKKVNLDSESGKADLRLLTNTTAIAREQPVRRGVEAMIDTCSIYVMLIRLRRVAGQSSQRDGVHGGGSAESQGKCAWPDECARSLFALQMLSSEKEVEIRFSKSTIILWRLVTEQRNKLGRENQKLELKNIRISQHTF